MVLRSNPVPIPAKKIIFKTASNGSIYAYYTVRAYRNKAGTPTSDEVAIGKKDPITGVLIPNRRYFKLFDRSLDLTESKPPDAKRGLVFPTRVARSVVALIQNCGLHE